MYRFEPRREQLPDIEGLPSPIFCREIQANHSLKLDHANTIRAGVLYRNQEKPSDYDSLPNHTDLIIWSVVDRNNKPVFEATDKESLEMMPVSLYNLLVETALRVSRAPFNEPISNNMDKDNPLDI